MKPLLDENPTSWPFWKASILCAVVGGILGALLALMGM